jgi:hypothetical protein
MITVVKDKALSEPIISIIYDTRISISNHILVTWTKKFFHWKKQVILMFERKQMLQMIKELIIMLQNQLLPQIHRQLPFPIGKVPNNDNVITARSAPRYGYYAATRHLSSDEEEFVVHKVPSGGYLEDSSVAVTQTK